MKYKIESHAHTKESSPCSRVSAKDLVDTYIANGYDGIIITDHYSAYSFGNIFKDVPWEEKIAELLSGYSNAKKYAVNKKFDVFLAIELTFIDSKNDYIIYGMTKKFLVDNRNLPLLTISEFRKLADDNDLFIVQVHPCRPYLDPPIPDYLDAVEVYNGNKRHTSNNDIALKFAEKNNLPKTSGSDFHQFEDAATGGMILPYRIKTLSEFVCILRNNENKIELIRR